MDIQDLLDEVEEMMQDRPNAKKAAANAFSPRQSSYSSSRGGDPSTQASSSSSSRKKSVDNIDDLLHMIDDDDDDATAAPVFPRSSAPPGSSAYKASASFTTLRAEEFHTSSGSKKCSTLMLGGESTKRGVNTAFVSHNVCANLRCNDCDFTVVQFLGKKWSASADYMFFRENVPNEAKLRARMEASPDSAAYACQCKWLSIEVPTRADMCRVKWSCAGH